MKKIVLPLIILLLTYPLSIEKAICKIEQKPLTPFIIMAKGSLVYQKGGMTKIDFDKPSPIVIYKDGQYKFYEFDKIEDSLGYYYKPKLDNNGDPVLIKYDDPKYFSKIFATLQNKQVYGEIIGPQNFIGLSIFAHSPKEEGYLGFWWMKVYTKYSNLKNWEGSTSTYNGSKIDYPVGSICYLDDDYNYELQTKTKSGYKVERREALNPDLVNSTSIPWLWDLENLITKRGLGYFWMKIGSEDIVVDGKNYKMVKPMIHNGKLTISLYDLIDIIGGEMEFDNRTGKIIACRVTRQLWGKIEVIKLEMNIDDKKAYLNDKEIELSLAPFYLNGDKWVIYVSAKDICDIFKAKLHWRSIDNTTLIERFPARF